jgi:hypothetical protein
MRTVLLSREAANFIDCAQGIRPAWHNVSGQTAVLFDRFIAGKEIGFGMDPRSHYGALVARNSPIEDGICDFRVMNPQPSVRVFGGFAEQDLFIAMTYQIRTRLPFNLAVRRASQQWARLFPDHKPVTATTVDEYVGQPFFAC